MIIKLTKKAPLLLFFLLLIGLLSQTSCKRKLPQNARYFKNALDTTVYVFKFKEYKFRIDDLIAINVIAGSLRQEDANLYNLPVEGISKSGGFATYKVDSSGNITLPKVGKIQVQSLTKEEISHKIEKLLSDEVKNPLVIVRLEQFRVSVLGEVRKPGPTIMRTDKPTFLDAIIEAGDLTDYGKKDDILLLRPTNGKYETFKIDMTNTAFFNSPAFQLYPDDVIYVNPSDRKLNQSDDRASFLRETSVIISSISILMTLLYSIGVIKR